MVGGGGGGVIVVDVVDVVDVGVGVGVGVGMVVFSIVAQLRDPATGALMPGVTAKDMGKKSVGNDLDNARLAFQNFRVPRDALLSR